MPATISQQPIPLPTPDNLVQVVGAIRNALISATNTDAGRASASGQLTTASSRFTVVQEIIVPVTYTLVLSDDVTGTVTIPQLISLTLFNPVSGQAWIWRAPANLTRNGVIGQPLT